MGAFIRDDKVAVVRDLDKMYTLFRVWRSAGVQLAGAPRRRTADVRWLDGGSIYDDQCDEAPVVVEQLIEWQRIVATV